MVPLPIPDLPKVDLKQHLARSVSPRFPLNQWFAWFDTQRLWAGRYSRALGLVLVLRDRPLLGAGLSKYLIDRIHSSPKIEVLLQTEVTALHGERALEEITLRDNRTGHERRAPCRWLFVCIGGLPQTEWAKEVGAVRDEAGYLVTGPDLIVDGQHPDTWPLDRDPYYLETSLPGVFAAGDVRHGSVKRCASAVGEGAMAVALVHRYLRSA
jgi:thioredoxin reductase (NADPH)